MKHRHDLGETLHLDEVEQALLAVLLLRGAQTPGELRVRTERYVALNSAISPEGPVSDGGSFPSGPASRTRFRPSP